MERKTNIYFIFGAVVVLILGLAGIFGGYGWFLGKQQRVLTGTARPTFPYSDYTLEELNKMYPQTINENVKTTQSPEETHKKFLAALKAGNFDEAVSCCFREGDREDMRDGLQNIAKDGELSRMIRDLDTTIKIGEGQKLDGVSRVTYYYSAEKDGKKIGSTIDFVKNNQGVWLIESL